jgi:hypothetical protein
MTEIDVQNLIRIEAAKIGMWLLRNNSGALQDVNGRLIRFGLGNDSTATNKKIKSSDLIGVWEGRAVAIECKAEGWKNPFVLTRLKPTDREKAQWAFINLWRAHGGLACFATCWDDVLREFNIARETLD